MEINLLRTLSPLGTPGEIYLNGAFECVSLEDRVRELWDPAIEEWIWLPSKKVPGETAIPSGRYEIIINESTRFKRRMPLLLNVPSFSGIRVHNGGVVEHTEGCILTGQKLVTEPKRFYLTGSKDIAFPRFFKKVEEALKSEKVFIHIINGRPQDGSYDINRKLH